MAFVSGGSVGRIVRAHAAAALDWVWPPACPDCGARPVAAREQFCEACWARLRPLTPDDATWDLAEDGEDPLRAQAVFAVDAHFVAVLGASKYRGARAVGFRLCREAARRLPVGPPPEPMLAVPLTAAKLRTRGFNQPQDLVEELVRRGGRRAPPLLVRARGGASSAGRARSERMRAVAGAFLGRSATDVPGRVCLVDDIVTTGSTARECARSLGALGVAHVRVLALARAFAPSDDAGGGGREALERL